MTRNELITELCKREGGKRQAIDAGQAREVLAKLRAIIGEKTGVDLYDLLEWRTVCLDFANIHYEALRVYPWRGGKPVKK